MPFPGDVEWLQGLLKSRRAQHMAYIASGKEAPKTAMQLITCSFNTQSVLTQCMFKLVLCSGQLCFSILMCAQCISCSSWTVVGSTDNFESSAEASRISAGAGLGDLDLHEMKLRKSWHGRS